MSSETLTVLGGPIFNGSELLDNHYLEFIDGRCSGAFALSGKSPAGKIVDLDGDIFSPGYADLQVNGGGGVLLNDHPSVQTLETMANAHRQLGTTAFLPTLITSKPETIKLAIDAAVEACRSEIPGIAGLHLEGPHLSIAKKGAHDASLIRPMHSDDLSLLVDAVAQLPLLKVTIAPESVSLEQVQQLTAAGVLVSLGHTNASYQTCVSYLEAGARCVTHLFNAMSQFGSRDPGLVGAVLNSDSTLTGLIADGVHVHEASIHAALNSMGGMGRVYLVSDAMAVAGTHMDSFSLDGRIIHRRKGKLTLADGTLAGADASITDAIRYMVQIVGADLTDSLRSAVSIPRSILSNSSKQLSISGLLLKDFIRIKKDLSSVGYV